MATRAIQQLEKATVLSMLVDSGQSTTAGYPVAFSSTADTVKTPSAGATGFGVALTTAVAGAHADVLLPGPVVKVKVGTGGATQGKYAVAVSDGFTDSATIGGGTTALNLFGIFMQTGSAGDEVGMVPVAYVGVKS